MQASPGPVGVNVQRPGSRQMDRARDDGDGARTLQRTTGNDQLHQPKKAKAVL